MSEKITKSNSQERSDLVAYWSVPLCDGVHTVEFEHGTTSGKRVLRVDGQVYFYFYLKHLCLKNHKKIYQGNSYLLGSIKERLDV